MNQLVFGASYNCCFSYSFAGCLRSIAVGCIDEENLDVESRVMLTIDGVD